jgi:hypothetical protein
MENRPRKNNNRRKEGEFFCPLGSDIMWWRGFIYGECPLSPSYRDMSQCKDCPLRRDEKWESNKETWKDTPRKKSKRNKNQNRG